MWFFRRAKQSEAAETKIQAIHQETFARIDKATESIDKAAESRRTENHLVVVRLS